MPWKMQGMPLKSSGVIKWRFRVAIILVDLSFWGCTNTRQDRVFAALGIAAPPLHNRLSLRSVL